MAKLDELIRNNGGRTNRYFSQEFKQKKVTELDKKLTTIAEISKQYEVSRVSIYRWMYKYSLMKKKGIKMIVESKSDTGRIKALKEHIAELEQMLGRKQFEIDFLKKQMEIASEQYGVDLKKKLSGKHSPGSGDSGNNMSTK